MKSGNDNVSSISRDQVPTGKKITYANSVLDYLPRKDEPWYVRLKIGGDRLPYPSESGSPDATILEAKIISNSVIWTPGY